MATRVCFSRSGFSQLRDEGVYKKAAGLCCGIKFIGEEGRCQILWKSTLMFCSVVLFQD